MANEIGDDDAGTDDANTLDENNEETGEQCPSEPVGSLKKPKDKWLKNQGVDPHDLKKNLGDSKLDIYVDRDGNIWTLPKDMRGASPQWEGHLDHFKD